jgi:hypothetical protein
MKAWVALAGLWLAAAPAIAQPPPAPWQPAPQPLPGVLRPGPAPAPAPPPRPDPIASTVIQAVMIFGGPAKTEFDRTLDSHGYGASESLWGGDGTVLARVSSWLHLGGRAGVRYRRWKRFGDGDLGATGADLLVLASARWQLGRIVGLGLDAGIGVGHVTVVLREQASAGVSPRFVAGGAMSYRITMRLHALVRVGYEWFRWSDANRFGDDLDLGGLALALGVELRT